MIDIKNIQVQPTLDELGELIANPLFDVFFKWLCDEFKILYKIEFSKDVWAMGWNIKCRKAGKSLCVIYPKQGYFTVLVVVGRKQREQVEALLPQLDEGLQEVYWNTKFGNDQRWLMLDIVQDNQFYRDVLKLVEIRRFS